MKKILLSLFLTLATLFSLCGCSDIVAQLDRVINDLDISISSIDSDIDESTSNDNYISLEDTTIEETTFSSDIEEPPDNTQIDTVTTSVSDYQNQIIETNTYTSKDEVALYLHNFGHLPSNYITKEEAKSLGWDNTTGNLWDVASGKSIGGDYFGNYEGKLPSQDGRKWYECDINYNGGYRGAERILYSNDSLIYYTDDHYNTFTQLY